MLADTIKTDFCAPDVRETYMDTAALPFSRYLEAITIAPYASSERTILQFLAYTGCRLAELKNAQIIQEYAVILLGKNQKGYRREPLPATYLAEIAEYRRTHRVPEGKLFGIDGPTFRRYFNGRIRPILGDEWNRRDEWPRNTGYVRHKPFLYELKGIRKSFATTVFWREWQRWKSPDAALLFTAKRMRHHHQYMTAIHYLKEFGVVEAEKWNQYLTFQTKVLVQKLVTDF